MNRAEAQSPDAISTGFVELRLNTCDVDKAGTDDPVYVDLEFLDVNNAGKEVRSSVSYSLDSPNDDFERGHQDRFVLPGFGRLSRLTGIGLRKEGNEGWCVSGLQLFVNGQGAALSYSGTDADDMYVGPHKTPKQIWIDDQVADAPGPSATFSDFTSVTRAAWVTVIGTPRLVEASTMAAPVYISVTAGLGVERQDPITVEWWHDGAIADPVTFKRPSTGETTTVLLGYYVDEIESLSLHMNTKNNNGFAVDRVTVSSPMGMDGVRVWVDRKDLGGLGRGGLEWAESSRSVISTKTNGRKNFVTKDTGYSHLPLRRFGAWIDNFVGLISKPATARPICTPPASIENAELESLVATQIVQSWADCGDIECSWQGGSVEVTRTNATTLHAHADFGITFEGPAGHEYNRDVDVDLDIKPSCDSSIGKLTFKIENLDADLDKKFIEEFASKFSKKVDRMLKDGMDRLDDITVPSVSADVPLCPSITLSKEGDIDFAWPSFVPTNQMCL